MKTPYDRLLDKFTSELRAEHPQMASQKLFDEAARLAAEEQERRIAERA